MTQNNGEATPPTATAVEALKRLEKLVGMWSLTGRTPDAQEDNISGQVTIEWLPGGFFLEQRGEIDFKGTKIQSLEIVFYNSATNTFPSQVYSNMSEVPGLYYWNIEGDVVTHGTKGSIYRGTFNEDSTVLTGGWRPEEGQDGVTYDAIMTKTTQRKESAMSELQTLYRDFTVTRVFNAPVEQVWKAWTEPEQVIRWWGPKDYTSPFCRLDLHEGGKYLFCMHAPDYQGSMDYYSAGVYTKIVPLELLEFTQNLADKDGNTIDPVQTGMPPDFPQNIRIAITFKTLSEEQTEMTVTEYNWPEGQLREMSQMGMEQTLDKMAEALK